MEERWLAGYMKDAGICSLIGARGGILQDSNFGYT